ncbi:MAG: PepSY domain-containing protein [Clostridia bacterium]|nr:PepSY domain-containing protein [Clostridia bacterium]
MENKMNMSAKTLFGICLVILCLLIATLFIPGCSNQETENSTVVPQSTADTTVSGQNATEKPIETQSTVISKETAKQTALSHAGLSGKNVERYESKLDFEDGRQVYEIEFDFEGYEYDYEIDAKNGEVLKFDKEPR